MTLRIVGYEGSRDADSPVNWGIAALADDDWLLNSATQHRTPLTHLDSLESEGHLTRIRDLDIEAQFAESPLVVLELLRADAVFTFLVPDTGKAGGLVGHRSIREYSHYIFEGQNSFDRYAVGVATKITHALLYQAWPDTTARARLLRAGCVVSAHHPALNALRVASLLPKRIDRARQLALGAIHVDADRERFTDLLEALTADDKEDYVIKYEDGIAEGGGLDIDEGVRILGSAKTTHPPFAKELVRRHPYLSAPPPPRFHHMQAASASLHFTAHIKGQPLGERVARQLELRMLERSLRGMLPGTVSERAKVERAIDVLRSPDAETTVSHVPLRGAEERLTERTDKSHSRKLRSEPMTMLGYQSGLVKLAGEIEVVVFPPQGKHHRNLLRLSTHDDGDGNEPTGARPLQEGDSTLLYRPMLFTIIHNVDGVGRETVHLRKVQALDSGKRGVVTAIPSSVVDGVVMYGFNLTIRRSKGRLVSDLGSVDGLEETSLSGAREWMAKYAEVCLSFELEPKARAVFKLWRPTRPPAPSALQRILLVLKQAGGSLHQSRLVDLVNERFGGSVRTNNTRREVNDHPDLLEFDESAEQVIRLRARGGLVAAAYERAGVRTAKTKSKARRSKRSR